MGNTLTALQAANSQLMPSGALVGAHLTSVVHFLIMLLLMVF